MSSLRPPTYISRDPRPAPTAAPPPPHTPLSNPSDQSPPVQYAPTSSIPGSANSSHHHPSGKCHRHKKRCAASYSRPCPPIPPPDRSDRASPSQSNTSPLYRTVESTSSRHSLSSTRRPKPRPRNTQTYFSDSLQSTSPARRPPPAQSTETSVRKKCRPSSRPFFRPLFSPAEPHPSSDPSSNSS